MIQKAIFTRMLGVGFVSAILGVNAALADITPQQYDAVRAHVERGNTFYKRNMFEQALAEYAQGLAIDPKNAIARENLGLCHNQWGVFLFKQKKYEEADREFEEALKVNPNQLNARKNLQILKAELDRLGLELVDETPPPKAPAAPPGDNPGETEATAGAPEGGEPPGGAPGQAGGKPDASAKAGKPGTPAAAGKPQQKGKFSLSAGTGGEEAPPDPSQKAGAQPGGKPAAKAPTGGDEFDGGETAASPAPTQTAAPDKIAPQTRAGGRITEYPRGYEQDPSVGPGANPENSGVAGARIMSSPTTQTQQTPQATQPVQQAEPTAATVTLQAGTANQLSSPAVPQEQPAAATPPDATFASPQAAQPAPEQVYEDKAAGTSIKIMPRAEEAAPQAVQEQTPPPPTPPAPTIVPYTQPATAETTPAAPVASTPAASPSDGMTIEDQLTKIEMKVYGKKQKAAPIFKRLEKLEVDSTGSVHVGTVQERVDNLRHQYGL